MRILVLGTSARHRSEHSIARAARATGHDTLVLDTGWHARLGPVGARLASWRVDRFAPDFVLSTRHALALGERTLRTLLGRRRSAFWYFDAVSPLPGEARALAAMVDVSFATYGFQEEAFRALGVEARFLPQGADPFLDFPAPNVPGEWRSEVGFIGSGQYPRRHLLLRAMAGRFNLKIRGPGWDQAPQDLPVAGGPVRGAGFRAAVGAAQVNLGIDALESQRLEQAGGTSNRLWRILACGGCYLAERVEGIERFVVPGEQALWFRTADEAVELTTELLADPARRARLAEAGRRHVLAHHTYAHRLPFLLESHDYSST
jgi:hypothetical protein